MNISVKQKVTVATLLVALGIIYGDIGTSPLYVMKAIIGDRPINELLVNLGQLPPILRQQMLLKLVA